MSPHESRDDELSDATLLEQIRAGDEHAQCVFFDRYYQRLIGFAKTKMALDLQRVEPPSDVAQSTMKSVLMGIPLDEFQLDEGKSLWPLLAKIAVNKIVNRGRKSRPLEVFDVEQLAVTDLTQDGVVLQDLVSKLLEAFSFSEKRRKIVELILQEYRPGEIAELMQVSTRTVLRTRKEAEKALRQLLD